MEQEKSQRRMPSFTLKQVQAWFHWMCKIFSGESYLSVDMMFQSAGALLACVLALPMWMVLCEFCNTLGICESRQRVWTCLNKSYPWWSWRNCVRMTPPKFPHVSAWLPLKHLKFNMKRLEKQWSWSYWFCTYKDTVSSTTMIHHIDSRSSLEDFPSSTKLCKISFGQLTSLPRSHSLFPVMHPWCKSKPLSTWRNTRFRCKSCCDPSPVAPIVVEGGKFAGKIYHTTLKDCSCLPYITNSPYIQEWNNPHY